MYKRHGYSTSTFRIPEYNVWASIIQRCENSNHKFYDRYGGRGITICADWRNSFPTFLNDMGLRPSSKHTIGRIDNNKGYEPSNCRWELMKEQAMNKRNNVKLECNGKFVSVHEYASMHKISNQAAYKRIQRATKSKKNPTILMDGTIVRREP